MMNAYDKDYLYHSQKNFGHMVDFAVNTCEYDIDKFFQMFIVSNVCTQYESGNPAYIVGKTGCELVRLVVSEIRNMEIENSDVMYLDKSEEYWLGWSLSYYVWLKNYKFSHVLTAVPASEMLGMYNTMHEADITKFVVAIDDRLGAFYTQTALTRMRIAGGFSQKELAECSGVNVRIIQSYKQRVRDINKAQLSTVVNLSQALDCNPVELMER